MRSSLLRLCTVLCVLAPFLAHAAVLENPGNDQIYSGIGVISGWKCEATAITVAIDDGDPIPMLHGSERGDTKETAEGEIICGDTPNGFVAIWNWALLSDGEHEAVAYDNGVEFARSTFTVGTLGEAFVEGETEVWVEDFPSPGESTLLGWNESSQHFEVVPEGSPDSNGALSSAPPTWVFAGDVPDAHRTALREEMEYVRTWFADQYGVKATGFTVLVGTDYEALAPVARDVVGLDLSNVFVPPGHGGPASLLPSPFVTTANDGRSVMVLVYGRNPFDSLKDAIAHEYFHVLQHQLAPGYQTSEVKPYWLVEGLAQYADYVYSQSRLGRRPFLDRYSPYRDLADAINLNGVMTPGTLEWLADFGNFRNGCDIHPIYVYAMAFAGADLLVGQAEEDSYAQYWQLLHDRPTWQQAFEEAFGLGIEDFYAAFEEWLPSRLPSYVQLSVWLRWPGKEALSREVLGPLAWSTTVAPDIVTRPSFGNMSWGGISTDGAHTITSNAGAPWTGYLSLWWQSDACTEHLLGWYKDGELTDQRTDATLVEFPGRSSSLEWTLPARPDMLPRLSEETLLHCTP